MNLSHTPYAAIFSEVYTAFSQCMPVQQTDEYWRLAGTKVIALAKKYEKTEYEKFANDMLCAIYHELGRISDSRHPE